MRIGYSFLSARNLRMVLLDPFHLALSSAAIRPLDYRLCARNRRLCRKANRTDKVGIHAIADQPPKAMTENNWGGSYNTREPPLLHPPRQLLRREQDDVVVARVAAARRAKDVGRLVRYGAHELPRIDAFHALELTPIARQVILASAHCRRSVVSAAGMCSAAGGGGGGRGGSGSGGGGGGCRISEGARTAGVRSDAAELARIAAAARQRRRARHENSSLHNRIVRVGHQRRGQRGAAGRVAHANDARGVAAKGAHVGA